jgi:transcriptional regulator with PAS, ATPase and Fis domain
MTRDGDITEAAHLWTHAPFSPTSSTPVQRWRAARALLDPDAIRRARRRLKGSDELQVVLLAHVVVTLMAGRPLPRGAQRGEGGLEDAQLRVAVAAGRCGRRLMEMEGWSLPMQRLRHAIWQVCFGADLIEAVELIDTIRDHHILIQGETGTGKERVAQALREGTIRGAAEGGDAAVNVASLSAQLVESELFGYREGAFTGASGDRAGLIESCHGGSLFLDEIGELPLAFQAKLLRAIQEGRVRRVGDTTDREADVRFISATHRDLGEMVREGRFREDLLRRLRGYLIRVPPLRERVEDIPVIGASLLPNVRAVQARQRGLDWLNSQEVREHRWPGNIRELQATLRNTILGLESEAAPREPSGPSIPQAILDGTMPERAVREWYEARVLSKCGQNRSAAARRLGVAESTLLRRARERQSGQ